MRKKYIIMDVDTGVDDSMALMLAAAHPELEILALTCTFGNNDVDVTTYNTLKVSELLGLDVPVGRGAVRPMLETPLDYSEGLGPLIHGRDGLGNAGSTLPEPVRRASTLTAPDLMAKAIREAPEKVTIAATGPLTNVAAFLVSYPDLADRIEQIALMGGAAFGGNMAFSVEANIGHDPEAAAIVFRSRVRKVVFGLDATMGVYITDEKREELERLGDTVGRFLRSCLQPYADIYRQLANWPGAVLHDSLPVAWLLDESAASLRPAVVDIELHGRYSRGATVVSFDCAADTAVCRIAMAADREKIVRMHLDAVKQFAKQ